MALTRCTVGQLTAAIDAQSAARCRSTCAATPTHRIDRVAPLERAGSGALSFLANPRYRRAAPAQRAGALVLSAADADALAAARARAALLVCDQPVCVVRLAAHLLAPMNRSRPASRVAAASTARRASIRRRAVDAGAIVEAGAVVARGRAHRRRHACSDAGARVGERHAPVPGASRSMARATSARAASCTAGAVIGADGFGFAPLEGRWVKIPQIGRVVHRRRRRDRRQHDDRPRHDGRHRDRGRRQARQPDPDRPQLPHRRAHRHRRLRRHRRQRARSAAIA